MLFLSITKWMTLQPKMTMAQKLLYEKCIYEFIHFDGVEVDAFVCCYTKFNNRQQQQLQQPLWNRKENIHSSLCMLLVVVIVMHFGYDESKLIGENQCKHKTHTERISNSNSNFNLILHFAVRTFDSINLFVILLCVCCYIT